MKIGIDIDDTIAYTNEKLIEAAVFYDKEFLDGKGFKDKNAYKFVEMFYWNQDNVQGFFNWVRSTNFFLELEVVPNALEVINKMYDEGYQIYFMTYRTNKNPYVLENTKKWLDIKGFKYHKLFMRNESKGKLCKDMNVDLFIDNTFEHVKDARNHGIDAILFDTIYNRDIVDDKRYSDWNDIYKYVKEGKYGKNS